MIIIEVMEGRLKPVEMEGGKALIGDVRSISSYVFKKRLNSTRDILTTKLRKSTQF